MIWPAVIGAGASLLGGMLNKSKPAGHKFRPMDASAQGMGSAEMTKEGISLKSDAFDNEARSFFNNQFRTAASDPMGLQLFGQDVVGMGQGLFDPTFQASMQAGFDPTAQALAGFNQNMQGTSSFLGNMGQQGINAAFNGPSAAGLGGAAGQFGLGLMGQTDLSQLAANHTAQLNTLAGPAEQAATNQKFQSLFGSGRLGTSGGLTEAMDLAGQQNRAAAERGLMGMQFAEGVRNSNMQNAQGFLGQGLNAIGMDQNQAQFLGTLGQGMIGQDVNMQQQMFQNQFGLNEAQVGRADNRLQRVNELFGFGTSLAEQPTAAAARALQGTAPIDARTLAMGDMAIRASNAASGTQGGSGGNAFGSALQGMGSGLFSAGIDNMFKSGSKT